MLIWLAGLGHLKLWAVGAAVVARPVDSADERSGTALVVEFIRVECREQRAVGRATSFAWRRRLACRRCSTAGTVCGEVPSCGCASETR